MKSQNCRVCGKEYPDEVLAVECPDCYIKGAKIERDKTLAEVEKIIDDRLKLLEKAGLKCDDIGNYLQGYQELMELKQKLKGEKLNG